MQQKLMDQSAQCPQSETESAHHPVSLPDRALIADVILSSALDCIVIADVHGQIVEFNPAAERAFDMRRDEVIGKTMEATIIPPVHREAHRKGMARYVAGGAPAVMGRRVEMEAQRRDGSVFPIELTITEAKLGGERLFVANLRDISEQKRAAEELQRARASLQAIFDHIPAELYLRDVDGTYILMNRWGAAQLGMKPEELIGRSIREFRLPSEEEAANAAEAKLLETGAPVTREYQIPYAGRIVTGLITIFPVRDAKGKIAHIGGIVFDVTELHNARQQLQQARENLHQSEKLAALGQLLAGVAHELNNPLAIVLGRSAMLIEKLKGTPHVASLQKLREAANRCTRIVGSFLALARQTGPRREAVKLHALIDGVIEMTGYGLRNASIAVSQDRDPTVPDIEADSDQIIQVLINLIINAQHALEASNRERRMKITTRFQTERASVVIEVSDNGPGVPSDVADRIFEPFFTTKAVGQGTGLGLSLCKSLVEAHGGTLTLHETQGGGATFRMILPVGVLRPATVEADTGGQRKHEVGGHVLIVDDELEIAAILADCLSALGITCELASDGATALAKIARTDFDAVFCDVTMPGMDGIAMHRKLKEIRPELADRLVFVSGDLLHRNIEKAKALAGRPIIEKPFDPELVRQTARDMLNRKGVQP